MTPEAQLEFPRWEGTVSALLESPDEIAAAYITHLDDYRLPRQEVFYGTKRQSQIGCGRSQRHFPSLTDLNGDGVADLVVVSLEGSSISEKRSTYEVHLGTPTTDDGTVFARGVDIALKSNGRIQLGMERHDFDRDGQVDLMLTTIDREFLKGSLWKSLKGFMGDDIWLDLEFYRNEEGRYPDTPNAIRKIALDGVPSHREPGSVSLDIVFRGATHEHRKTQKSWPRAFNSTLLIGDVTGDGLSDLVIGHHPRRLDVFVGVRLPSRAGYLRAHAVHTRASSRCRLTLSPWARLNHSVKRRPYRVLARLRSPLISNVRRGLRHGQGLTTRQARQG